jgi:phosphoketolase
LASKNINDDTEEDSEIMSSMTRRRVFSMTATAMATAAAILTMTTTRVEPASATYSAYTRRERDWQERQKGSGADGIQYKSAKDLRNELRQIAPMNSEKSRIFCPNGPSSNVSPLMENKCSDEQMAMPSVYGRSNDILGNSVPGFTDGRSSERYATSLATEAGGFPSYFKTK